MAFIDENFIQEQASIVFEGWGYLLTTWFGPQIRIGNSSVNVLRGGLEIYSEVNLKKLMSTPAMAKYFKEQCEKLHAELKKTSGNKNWTEKIPSGPINAIKRLYHGTDGIGFFDGVRWTNFRSTWWEDKIWHVNTNGYNITFFYDSDHIDAAVVLFYNTELDQIVGKRIPAPTSDKLKALGFRLEKL